MSNFYLKIVGGMRPNTEIFIDGKRAKISKKNGEKVVEYQTDNPTVELKIKRYTFLNLRLWFLVEVFFFLISVFGIFDKRIKKPYIESRCKFTLVAGQNTFVNIRLMPVYEGGKVILLESNCAGSEDENIFVSNKKLKNRNRVMRLTKFLLLAASVITLIVILI